MHKNLIIGVCLLVIMVITLLSIGYILKPDQSDLSTVIYTNSSVGVGQEIVDTVRSSQNSISSQITTESSNANFIGTSTGKDKNTNLGVFSCGAFSIKYDTTINQIGINIDQKDLDSYYFGDEQSKIELLKNIENSKKCPLENAIFNMSVYSKDKDLLCYNCDQGWIANILLKEDVGIGDFSGQSVLDNSTIIDQKLISIANVQNARIVTYEPKIAGNIPYIVKDLFFDYKGISYLFGINFRDDKSDNFRSRSNYVEESQYDNLLIDAINNLEINPNN